MQEKRTIKRVIKRSAVPECLCFIVPVWGDHHTKVFTELVLPSYLSKGNLPSCYEFNCSFYIYTNPSSELKIKKSDAFKKLLLLCKEVIFKHIDDLPNNKDLVGKTYSALKNIHEDSIRTTANWAPALFFLNADTTYADGSFANVIKLLKQGYRSVELVTIRVDSEKISTPLKELKEKGILDISPIALVNMGLQYLHKISRWHFWNSNEDRLIPDNLYWKVKNEGILARCSHLHPLMVYPKNYMLHFTGTIDHDFIENSGIREDEKYVVTNNLEIAGLEISPSYHSQNTAFYSPQSAFDVARFLYTLCTENNKKNLEHKVWLHGAKNINVNEWKKIEKDSDKVITEVKNCFYEGYICKPFVRSHKLQARVLIPIWGHSYVDNFCEISLPSLLAKGNWHYLNEKMDLEIVFLTTKDSKQYIIDKFLSMNILCSFSIRFIFIDDLLAMQHYGIILTAAYARGFQDAGKDQTKIHFFLLNADFILSKNTYKTMYKYITEGYDAVLISTLRANEETALPALKEIIVKNHGTLEATGRTLVGITLENLHDTSIANIVNRSWMHHNAVNQLFYQAHENCLIGRFFLLFMGCIKPEKPMRYVSGFCDYTFVSDLCPSKNITVIQDSDEGYMLELQKKSHDSDYIKLGAPQIQNVARMLSKWTNKEHRFYGTQNIIIHSDNLPKNLQSSLKKFDEYMESIYSFLSPEPQPVHLHPIWEGTISFFQISLPLEKNSVSSRHVQTSFFKGADFIKKFYMKLNPQHSDQAILRKSLEDSLRKFSEKKILIIRSAHSQYDACINKFRDSYPKADITFASCGQVIHSMFVFPEMGFDLVILLIPHSLEKILNTYDDLINKTAQLVAPTGRVLLTLQSAYYDETVDFILRNVMSKFRGLELSVCEGELAYGRRRLENIRRLTDMIIVLRQKNLKQFLKEICTLNGIKKSLNQIWILCKICWKIAKQNKDLQCNTVKEDEGISYVTTVAMQLEKTDVYFENNVDKHINKNNIVKKKKIVA